MKTKPTKKQKPAAPLMPAAPLVAVKRFPAKVEVVISHTMHTITEDEAKRLHKALGEQLYPFMPNAYGGGAVPNNPYIPRSIPQLTGSRPVSCVEANFNYP